MRKKNGILKFAVILSWKHCPTSPGYADSSSISSFCASSDNTVVCTGLCSQVLSDVKIKGNDGYWKEKK